MTTQTVTTKICSKCGEEKLLGEYYTQPTGKNGRKAECKKCNLSRCKNFQKEYYSISGNRIRKNEYKKTYHRTRYNNSFYFKTRECVRANIAKAFSKHSTNGKVMSSKKYGIDYAAIFQKLGEKPEGNFHIDHIIPISKFNLDIPEHVRLSHSPENLRWLDATENIQKSDSIDWSLIDSCPVLSNIAKEIGLKKLP
jgi:hypothetical protein